VVAVVLLRPLLRPLLMANRPSAVFPQPDNRWIYGEDRECDIEVGSLDNVGDYCSNGQAHLFFVVVYTR
jgi:hypothetical protein